MARKYKTVTPDQAGKTRKENRVERTFWKYHTVEDMMLLTSTELDQVIDAWMTDYEERQLKINKAWWYPTVTIYTLNDARNKRMKGVDKKPKIY